MGFTRWMTECPLVVTRRVRIPVCWVKLEYFQTPFSTQFSLALDFDSVTFVCLRWFDRTWDCTASPVPHFRDTLLTNCTYRLAACGLVHFYTHASCDCYSGTTVHKNAFSSFSCSFYTSPSTLLTADFEFDRRCVWWSAYEASSMNWCVQSSELQIVRKAIFAAINFFYLPRLFTPAGIR